MTRLLTWLKWSNRPNDEEWNEQEGLLNNHTHEEDSSPQDASPHTPIAAGSSDGSEATSLDQRDLYQDAGQPSPAEHNNSDAHREHDHADAIEDQSPESSLGSFQQTHQLHQEGSSISDDIGIFPSDPASNASDRSFHTARNDSTDWATVRWLTLAFGMICLLSYLFNSWAPMVIGFIIWFYWYFS
jgi:hypothetical protein